MFYSPARIALFGVLVWIALWLVMPLQAVGRLNPGALLYVFLGYVGFFIGTWLVRVRWPVPTANDPVVWRQPLNLPVFWTTVAMGLLGLILRIADRLYFRGVQYGADVLELREQLAGSSTSIAGLLAGVFLPLCLVPFMLVLASADRRNRALLAVGVLLFLIPTGESLFQLSRSVMLLTVGMAFATVSITYLGGRVLNRRLIAFSALGSMIFAIVSSAIFSARIEAGYGRLIDSVFESGYAELIQPNAFAWETLVAGSDAASFGMLSILPNGMYYLSGLYEFNLLFERPDAQPFAYGQLLFYPFMRAFYKLTGSDALDALDLQGYLYREGIWQTFFGPVWADFGWFGPAFMILFGFLSQALAIRVRKGSISILPIYIYFSMVIFFFPVINFLTNGLGMLAITSLTLFAIISSRIAPPPPAVVRPEGRVLTGGRRFA